MFNEHLFQFMGMRARQLLDAAMRARAEGRPYQMYAAEAGRWVDGMANMLPIEPNDELVEEVLFCARACTNLQLSKKAYNKAVDRMIDEMLRKVTETSNPNVN